MLVNCCSFRNVESNQSQYDINKSTACKVINVLLLVAGILVTSLGGGGVVASVVFGIDFSIFTPLVLGVTIGIGLLLLVAGINCLICRSLVSKAQASRLPLPGDQDVLILRKAVAESQAAAAAAEANFDEQIRNFTVKQQSYQGILDRKKQEAIKVAEAKENLLATREKIQSSTDSETLQSKYLIFSRVKKDSSEFRKLDLCLQTYLEAVDGWSSVSIQLDDEQPQVDSLMHAAQNLSRCVEELLKNSRQLCNLLENKVSEDQLKINGLKVKIVELEQKIQDLKITNSTQDETIKILNQQLEDLRQAKAKLEQDQEKKLADILREKASITAKLTATVTKLERDKVRGKLQSQLSQISDKLKEEKDKVEDLEQILQTERAKGQASEEEILRLNRELESRQNKIKELTEKIQNLEIVQIRYTSLSTKLSLEKQEKENERSRNEKLLQELESLREKSRSEIDLQVQKIVNLQKELDSISQDNSELKNTFESLREKSRSEKDLHMHKIVNFQKELDSISQDNSKLKNTLELYERMFRAFEEKLGKKKHKELAAFKTVRENLAAFSHYSREHILTLSQDKLYKKIDEQSKELQEERERNQELQQRINQLESQITSLSETTTKQLEQIESKDKQIEELQSKLLESSRDAASSRALVQAMAMSLPESRRQQLLSTILPSQESPDKQPPQH
ncbi:hypothetical protein BOKEGFJH_00557 [Chlamydia avium]|nr:hypothetical protein BOKEGFJH_00557 [Chlamydia avium]